MLLLPVLRSRPIVGLLVCVTICVPVLLTACHTPKDTKSAATTSAAAQAAPAIIRFERTPCMGQCPTYTAEITADGTLRYTGRKFAPKEGDTTARVAPDFIAAVRAAAKEMRFDLMPSDKYGHGMMDAPSAILTIDGHTVTCVGGECPPELKRLHNYVDREVTTALGR